MRKIKNLLKNAIVLYYSLPKLVELAYLSIRHSRPRRIIATLASKGQKCVVLGNGPSLKNDIDNLRNQIGTCDFFSVNHFADGDAFDVLKPIFYIFLDPYFWSSNVTETYKEKRSRTFENIKHKVTWGITIFIPSYADPVVFEGLKSNKCIKIFRYNGVGVTGVPHSLYCSLMKTGFCAPYAINVVHHAIFSAMRMGYKAIDVYGIDSSVLQSFEVDQKTNQVYVVHKHYYGELRTIPNEAGLAKFPLTLAQCLQKEIDIFIGYEILSAYARKENIDLRNNSFFSLVDSLKRTVSADTAGACGNLEVTAP